MDNKTLRQKHPQKYYLKHICSLLYYMGTGDCWYEESPLPPYKQFLYNCWKVIATAYMFLGIFNEYCAIFRTDLTEKEKNDLLLLCVAHFSIGGKISLIILQKNRIKKVMKMFLENDKRISNREVEEESVKKTVKYIMAISVGSFVTLVTALVDRVTQHFRYGIPFRVEVTLYPKSNDTPFSWILRFLVEVHWYYIVGVMALVDSLCSACLIFLAARFQILQKYFEGLKEKFLRNVDSKTQDELEDEHNQAVVEGIKKHEYTLWCTREFQYAFGNFYSLQMIESISLLAVCLFKLVINEHNLTLLVANFSFYFVMIIVTGVYMIPAGDVSWEAGRVQMSIFHSGWELVSRRSRNLRPLLVVALIRSQVPVEMTVFGIYTLSYANFISVIRLSYSFFAVMY